MTVLKHKEFVNESLNERGQGQKFHNYYNKASEVNHEFHPIVKDEMEQLRTQITSITKKIKSKLRYYDKIVVTQYLEDHMSGMIG